MKKEEHNNRKEEKMESLFSIVIPTKNEAGNIGTLLESLTKQTYPAMHSVPIYVADAQSTDSTRDEALSFKDSLLVRVVDGGPVAVGRNVGAYYTKTKYVLFMDADVELDDVTLLERVVALAQKKKLWLITVGVMCREHNLLHRTIYVLNNLAQWLSQYVKKQYATGMFMFFDCRAFHLLGGFDEKVTYAEDYHLSQRIPPHRFRVIKGHITTSDRRFRSMGALKIVKMFLAVVWGSFRKNNSIFYRKNRYFHHSQKTLPK